MKIGNVISLKYEFLEGGMDLLFRQKLWCPTNVTYLECGSWSILGSWLITQTFATKHYGIKSDAKWPVKIIAAEIKCPGGRKAQLTYVIVPDAHKANYN